MAVSLPITAQIREASTERPHLALYIDLDPSLIASLITELDMPLEPPVEDRTGLSVSPVEPLLAGAVARLVCLLDTPQHIAFLAPLIMLELGYLLLSGPQGARLREMALTTGRTYRIVSAVEQLVQTYNRPLDVNLAEEVHMSVSGFYRQFRAVTSVSPLQFQKTLRLQEARRLLLGRESDVTGVSFHVGYESPSQFSREYRRLFGAPPSRDAARF